MTEKRQGAAEWLRGIADKYETKVGPLCRDMAELLGLCCDDFDTCPECRAEAMRAIADRIDVEQALPEGIEWPRFEDGELVKVGDTVGSDEPFTAKEIAFESERWLIKASARSVCGCFHGAFGDLVKRSTPKVLGADGVEIRVGDTVYCDDGDEPLRVTLIHTSGYRSVSLEGKGGEHYSLDPERLTHKRPDSWEKLEEDAKQHSCWYFGIGLDNAPCDDCPHGSRQTGHACWQNARLDIVRRAKALAKAGEQG